MIHSNPIWLRNRFEKISFLLRSQCAHAPTSTRINCERRRQSKRSVAALYKLPKRIIVMVLTVRHRFWYSISNVKRQRYVYLQPNAFKLHQKHNFQFDWDFVCANNCVCSSFVQSSLTHHYMRFILTLHTSCLLSNVKSASIMVLHDANCILLRRHPGPNNKDWIFQLACDAFTKAVRHVQMYLYIDRCVIVHLSCAKMKRFSCQLVNEMVSVTIADGWVWT